MQRALVTEERSPQITERSSSRLIWALLGLLVAIGVVLRLLRYGDTVFGDELSTLYIVCDHGLSGTVSAVSSDAEISPPLYFILAWVTTNLGSAPELVRLPSLIFGIAAIPLAFAVGARVAGRIAGLLAAAFMAINPFMVFYSVDGRGYMLALFLLLLSSLALLQAIDTRRTRWWILYGAASCLAMYSHYTVAFVLLVQLVWVLWAHPWARRPALTANFAAAIVFVPWLPSLIADTNSLTIDLLSALQGDGFTTKRIALESWVFGSPYSFPAQVPGALALRLGIGGLALAALAAAMGLFAGGLAGARRRLAEERWRRVALVLAMALATPAFEALILLAGGTDLFGARNLLTSSTGLGLAIGALMWAARSKPLGVLAAIAVFVALSVGVIRSLEDVNRTVEFKDPARTVAANAQAGDVLVDAASPKSTPVPLTSVDAHLDFSQGPEFRLFLPSGPPPFLPFRSPIPDPNKLLRQAFREAAGHRLFFIGAELEVAEAKPGAPAVITSTAGLERLEFPSGWSIDAQRSYEGITTVDLVVLSGPPA